VRDKILNVNDTLYYTLGTMNVEVSNEKGTDYWKERWRADSVLKNGNTFYYCLKILDAEYEML